MDKLMRIINGVAEGAMEPYKALVELEKIRKAHEADLDLIKGFKAEYMEHFANLKDEFPDGYGGFMFEYRKGSRRFSFTNIDAIKQEKEILKKLEAKYKAAFEGYEKGIQPVDENGELMELPKVTYGTDAIILKPIKNG